MVLIKLITCHIPEQYLAGIESLVNLSASIGYAVRTLINVRDLLKAELGTILQKKPE